MVFVSLAVVGFAVAAVAFALPQFVRATEAKSVASDSADWVNRLFVLAGEADASGREQVASAARSLISALIADKSKKA